MNDIFNFVERPYNLRSNYTLERKRNNAFYQGPKLWDDLPNSIKMFCVYEKIQNKINIWTADPCLCRICMEYVGRVGFI